MLYIGIKFLYIITIREQTVRGSKRAGKSYNLALRENYLASNIFTLLFTIETIARGKFYSGTVREQLFAIKITFRRW